MCSILSISFSIYIYLIYQERSAKNLKTLHKLVSLAKLPKIGKKKAIKSKIFRLPL